MESSRNNSTSASLLSKVACAIKTDPASAVVAAVVALACLSALVEFVMWIGGTK